MKQNDSRVTRRRVATGLALALVALSAAGCGRRGEPQLPPGVEPAPDMVDKGDAVYAPKRKFILDPLLK